MRWYKICFTGWGEFDGGRYASKKEAKRDAESFARMYGTPCAVVRAYRKDDSDTRD